MSAVATDDRLNVPEEAYNDLPLLPPKADVETKQILKAAIDAHVALANLRGAARSIPNDGILVRAIALQEAKASSEIEMIVTTQDDLYRALSQDLENGDPQTKEVLRYSEAVWLGYQHLAQGQSLSISLFEQLASTILERPTELRTGVGTRVGDPTSDRVIYTPPVVSDRLRTLLTNMLEYWGAGEPDVLVRLCVGHYQFEAIHPFSDANGRVGRVLNILYLLKHKLLEKPILYLSGPIIEDKATYYRGLRQVTERGEWEPWILYMLENLTFTAVETRRRVENIHRELESATNRARAEMRRGFRVELIQLIFSQPYTRIVFLERAGIAKRQAASEYLQELERIGLLKSEKRGREVYYVNDKLMAILAG
jgi:Fic family protein